MLAAVARLRAGVPRTAGPAVLAGFVAWAIAPIVAFLTLAAVRGRVWGGAWAAMGGADQYRYLAWIRDAGHHILVAKQFGFGAADHLYLHPMFLLSGLAWRAGAGLQVAYLLWLPPALAVLLGGYAAYAIRTLEAGWGRLVALALALGFVTPLLPALDWGDLVDSATANHLVVAAGASVPYWQAWGYLPTTLALGAMPLCVLALERTLAPDVRDRRRATAAAALAGLAVAWLFPWGGLTLLLLVAGVAAWERPARRTLPLLAVALALAAPLAYYWALRRVDAAWALGSLQANYDPMRPLWVLLATLGPLALPGVLAIRRPRDAGDRLLLLWPPAALATYFLLDRSGNLDALASIGLPLAVLAVRGWRRLLLPNVAAAGLVVLAVVPGMGYMAQTFRDFARSKAVPYTLRPGEADALGYLERTGPDRVLSSPYIGNAVPALAGDRTWAAFHALDPALNVPALQAADLFAGRMSPAAARALVVSTGATALLSDCASRARLAAVVGPLGFHARRFGCATVYRRVTSPRGGGRPPA
jgi:hypothetical protein